MIGASKIARDISESKRTQQALNQEIEERRRIFETSLDLILVTDPQGNFVRVSPSSMTEILGYQPEEMIGHTAVGFLHPDDLESTRKEMRIGAARPAHAQFRNALSPQERTHREAGMDRACGPSRTIATSSSAAT